MPEAVQKAVGFALWRAQEGKRHPHAKVLKGFGDAGVLEVIEDYDGDTYRAVYTVRFAEAVYALHSLPEEVAPWVRDPACGENHDRAAAARR